MPYIRKYRIYSQPEYTYTSIPHHHQSPNPKPKPNRKRGKKKSKKKKSNWKKLKGYWKKKTPDFSKKRNRRMLYSTELAILGATLFGPEVSLYNPAIYSGADGIASLIESSMSYPAKPMIYGFP